MTNDERADASAPDGGDPVCWLHLMCDSCGALLEHADDPHRPGCAAATTPPASEP